MSVLTDANERLALAAFDRITLTAIPLSANGQRLDREARLRAVEAAQPPLSPCIPCRATFGRSSRRA